jgi:hypothetical protein
MLRFGENSAYFLMMLYSLGKIQDNAVIRTGKTPQRTWGIPNARL